MVSRIRRLVPTLLAILTIVSLVAGCGGQGGQSTQTPAPSTGGTSTTTQTSSGSESGSGDQVTITWWHLWTGGPEQKWNAIAEAYMKEHPNVKIEITVLENEAFKQKIATAMQSNNPPDLFNS